MAELILSDEEKSASDMHEFDDASLGRCVKFVWTGMHEQARQRDELPMLTGALLLVAEAIKANSTRSEATFENVTYKDKAYGPWTVAAEFRAVEAAPTTPAKTLDETCRDLRHALIAEAYEAGITLPQEVHSWLMNGADKIFQWQLAPLFEKGEAGK